MLGGLSSSGFAQLGAASNNFAGGVNATSFSGNSLSLPVTTASGGTTTGGVITLGGKAFAHSFGSGGALGNASGNTFVGSGAGNFTLIPVSATANTGTGFQTLSSISTGYANTASGYSALSSNTTGTYNTAIGANAGVTATSANANTTGSLNTFIGASSGAGLPSASNLQNATAIGANALVSCSKCMVLGDSTLPMMVGIGTNTPSSVFHVVGSQPALSPGNGAAATPILQITGGKGGDTVSIGGKAGTGAAVNISAGAGGDSAGFSANGDGGSVTIQGGPAGSGGLFGGSCRECPAGPFRWQRGRRHDHARAEVEHSRGHREHLRRVQVFRRHDPDQRSGHV